jgi:lipopolysaccharide transport system ATP-binding protein
VSVVIRIEQLSKVYHLGEISRQMLWHDWRRKLAHAPEEDDPELFWALHDVSIDIRDGEVVGLLGRNGAGKSTLLKILSRITSPTRGTVKIKGRVAALLEVGTGFHFDLTGRDNVYLNGTILGMTRREVARKFDEIVTFAGVEGFIDTPVKRYSVGMRVRLAFAVAAHLESEILLMDEVLAVGDAAFQQKCLGKIGEVSRSGRTVIFVSHSAAAIESLCTRGVVLDRGRVVFDGTQSAAIDAYAESRTVSNNDLSARTDRTGTGAVRVTRIEVRNSSGQPLAIARAGSSIEVALHFERRSARNFAGLSVQITATTNLGAAVFTHANWLNSTAFDELPERGVFICRIPRLPLPAGHFHLGFRLAAGEGERLGIFDEMDLAGELHVEAGDFFGTGKLPPLKAGVCLVDGDWRLESVAEPALAS